MTGRCVPRVRPWRRPPVSLLPRVRTATACVVVACVFGVPGLARSAEMTLPEVAVEEQRIQERADGPVQGYRATRSGTFTKTDTPLKEVPASITVVPADLIQDQA